MVSEPHSLIASRDAVRPRAASVLPLQQAGGDSSGLVKFLQLCHASKLASVHLSMDVAGTPTGMQRGAAQWTPTLLDPRSSPAIN